MITFYELPAYCFHVLFTTFFQTAWQSNLGAYVHETLKGSAVGNQTKEETKKRKVNKLRAESFKIDHCSTVIIDAISYLCY